MENKLSIEEKQILERMEKTLPFLTQEQKENLLSGVTFAAMIIGNGNLKKSGQACFATCYDNFK